MLTLLVTSPRVAPGLLTGEAWSALRAASLVLAGSAEHPQVAALTSAGVRVEVLPAAGLPAAGRAAGDPAGDPEALAAALASAAADADGPVVWLAPPGDDAALLTDRLSKIPDAAAEVVPAAYDLPGAHLLDVVSIMDTLRVSCPWDREQTHASLLRYLLEEAYEAAETIETGDWDALAGELGDVLLQVLFHARVAAERPAADGGFTIDDVADVLAAKLTRRHPHVFGSVAVSSADDVSANWDEIKKSERTQRALVTGSGPVSALDGVAFGQPALSLAAQLLRRAERAGAPADVPAGGIGDELMQVVAQAQAAGVDPELALRDAARRFAERVREWERAGTPAAD
ncbi:MAG TPA: MazG family protein [Trebonia sp.]|nr:MazG family protein [Trebonia sp.]